MLDPTTSALCGTVGTLGAPQPIVSAFYVSNSGESIVYLSSSPITCETLQTSRWLGGTKAGSQVIELVIKGDPKLQAFAIPNAEAHYAPGGKSSSYEQDASAGSITFTKADVKKAVAGSFTATFANNDTVTGTFVADYCDGGQEY